MMDDYRNTKYCPKLECLSEKKKKVEEEIKKDHKRAIDMHTYISDNKCKYKTSFVHAYNGKCAYCGVSLDVIGWKQFEIDHFIPKSSSRFASKAQAGFIDNLVLACFDCNRAKADLELNEGDIHKVHPDKLDICKSFYRDADFYIRVSDEYSSDEAVNAFYNQLGLDSQIHRLDYLLMNMLGLRDNHPEKNELYKGLTKAIDLIRKKRR